MLADAPVIANADEVEVIKRQAERVRWSLYKD